VAVEAADEVHNRTPAGGERRARVALAATVLALVVGAATLDLTRVSKREFWGDGATYCAWAWSLAEDFDLRYEARHLDRIRREHSSGVQGLFRKRAGGGVTIDRSIAFPWLRRVLSDLGRLYQAKAFAYPLVAAPLGWLLGTRALVVTNALVFDVSVWLGCGAGRRRASTTAGALLAVFALLPSAPGR
jgi:hypothetical protein